MRSCMGDTDTSLDLPKRHRSFYHSSEADMDALTQHFVTTQAVIVSNSLGNP
jgi:hypothetical protein